MSRHGLQQSEMSAAVHVAHGSEQLGSTPCNIDSTFVLSKFKQGILTQQHLSHRSSLVKQSALDGVVP